MNEEYKPLLAITMGDCSILLTFLLTNFSALKVTEGY